MYAIRLGLVAQFRPKDDPPLDGGLARSD